MKYIDEFINYIKVLKKDSINTLISYKSDLIEFMDVHCDILNINNDTVSKYLEYLYNKGLSRNTISRKLSSIRSFYNYLVSNDIVSTNYFKDISNPKRIKSLPKYVKDNDLEIMFNSFDMSNIFEERNRLILELLYATGIRVSEATCIKLNDINMYDNTIKIKGKGSKERMVIYGAICEDILNLYLKDARVKLDKHNSEYLLLNKYGNKISERYIRDIIDDRVRKCHIDYHISPHTLRHTFATDMVKAGADLVSVKELMGHASLNTTSIYTHLTNNEVKRVYDMAHPRAKG